MCNMFYLHLMRVYYNKANRTVFLIGRLLQQLNLLHLARTCKPLCHLRSIAN